MEETKNMAEIRRMRKEQERERRRVRDRERRQSMSQEEREKHLARRRRNYQLRRQRAESARLDSQMQLISGGELLIGNDQDLLATSSSPDSSTHFDRAAIVSLGSVCNRKESENLWTGTLVLAYKGPLGHIDGRYMLLRSLLEQVELIAFPTPTAAISLSCCGRSYERPEQVYFIAAICLDIRLDDLARLRGRLRLNHLKNLARTLNKSGVQPSREEIQRIAEGDSTRCALSSGLRLSRFKRLARSSTHSAKKEIYEHE